jgi:3-hydroxyisobutyrate dehydrogenase
MPVFTTAFIGLGVMGYPMAGHLARAGHTVRVYNRTPARRAQWLGEHRGEACASPALAAEGADFVFMCVGNDADVLEVSLGPDGVLAGMAAGSVLIDHTTVSAEAARTLAAAARDCDIGFLDAPVSGGQAGAESGQLTIMVGGDDKAYARAEPVMRAYAKMTRLMGDAGAGQLTKMVNQICIAGVLQGLAEALDFAARAGLDPVGVVEVISKGAAQSWQMENRAGTMARDEFDFGFAVDWMRKDLEIVLRTGRALDARLPLTALVDQFYADVQAAGGGRWDTSSLISRLR